MSNHLHQVLSECARETTGQKINPNLIDHVLIGNLGVVIRMKAGYSRNLSHKKIKKYFGDK